jgi:hypothetical protein
MKIETATYIETEKQGKPLRDKLADIFEPEYFVSDYLLGICSIQVKGTRLLPWHRTRIWNECHPEGKCVAIIAFETKTIECYSREIYDKIKNFGEENGFNKLVKEF